MLAGYGSRALLPDGEKIHELRERKTAALRTESLHKRSEGEERACRVEKILGRTTGRRSGPNQADGMKLGIFFGDDAELFTYFMRVKKLHSLHCGISRESGKCG
jgi:hypothetical protein